MNIPNLGRLLGAGLLALLLNGLMTPTSAQRNDDSLADGAAPSAATAPAATQAAAAAAQSDAGNDRGL
jgi:hypothetical protein